MHLGLTRGASSQVYASGTVLGTPTWQDPKTHAIMDVFVMNLQTHTVYDYAPGSTKPESAGCIKIVKWPSHGLPR